MKIAVAGLALAAAMAACPGPAHAAAEPIVVPKDQGNYLIGCGGCHGIQGRSGRNVVPDLAGQVGYFLCTPEGRDYLLRLPNVAFANLSSADLTTMMNFVVFRFGANSVPAGSKPFTEAEVTAMRANPLRGIGLHAYRDQVVSGVMKACPAARELHDYDVKQDGREVLNNATPAK